MKSLVAYVVMIAASIKKINLLKRDLILNLIFIIHGYLKDKLYSAVNKIQTKSEYFLSWL